MAFHRREKSTFDCPRCGLRCLKGTETCPDCGMVFSRMEVATNKDAKQKIKRHDKDYIIYTKKLPSDVPYYKLLLFTIFLGLVGGHCFYVGRYWRGGLLLTNFVVLVLCVAFNDFLIGIDNGAFIGAVATVCGLIMFVWIYDLISVILKKFKIPVAIDIDKIEKDEEVIK